jgi:Trk K+ transport system NAD-binding subunit
VASQRRTDHTGAPVGLRARVRYRFDNAISRGASVVMLWLGLLTLAVVAVAAVALTFLHLTGVGGEDEELDFFEAFWQSLLRTLDPGTFSDDAGWTRPFGLLVTLAGIFLAGALIGLIANALDQRVEELRRGRSLVLEKDHTLILGWSDRVPEIVSELVLANESRSSAAVVVLADEDKTTMEEVLRDRVADLRTTRIVCRRGSTSALVDLARVNLAGARSVVVVGGGSGDAAAVKTLLAVRAASGTAPIVVEVNDRETSDSVRALFGERVVVVNSDAVVAELTAQACRQHGLSQVFRDLLDFEGDEIYFAPFPALAGRTYAEAQLAFESCSLMGVLNAGQVRLNPEPTTVLGAGDELIGIASDDSTFVSSGVRPTPPVPLPVPPPTTPTQRRIVVIGWSQLGPRVIAEIDEFLGSETTVEIVVDPGVHDPDEILGGVTAQHVRLEVSTHQGGPLEVALHAARLALHEVIILGRRDGVPPEEADAATLMLLLALNQLTSAGRLGPVRIVTELLEQRHAPLAMATGVDDFVVSDELTSKMIAQLSERWELDQVFRDLFDATGCRIELVLADRYGAASCTSFAQVVAAASAQGHSAIGYRRASDGVVLLNPVKSAPLALDSADEVLVLR